MADEAEGRSLAVLINADNTRARYASAIFDGIASLREANVRRVYGDFSGNRLSRWDSAGHSSFNGGEMLLAQHCQIDAKDFLSAKLSINYLFVT